ncbi:carbohydrate sulfotransferase 15-like [Corticium candelabrum]|uniref:carbohydrate sulfotransferase 15-like n=1 Tax=Corticium candelabrum TaxID=121492 RepID=UPI002E253A6B|nr:carbohydrate sulfotransferase 15-like [Corticium candelabrum]
MKCRLAYLALATSVTAVIVLWYTRWDHWMATRLLATRIMKINNDFGIFLRRKASGKDVLARHLPQVYRTLPRSGYNKSIKNPCWWVNTTFQYNFGKSYYSKKYKYAYKNMGVHWSYEKLETLLLQKKAPTLLCLPYFLLIGMPKCGTTDLYQRIVQHPQVIAPASKEPHWWSKRRNQVGGPTFLDYLFLFSMPAKMIRKNNHMVTGDGSASTMFYKSNDTISTAELLSLVLPQAKLLVILRNPVDRLYSEYLDFGCRKRGFQNCSSSDFHKRVAMALLAFKNCSCRENNLIKNDANYTMRLHLGIYHEHLQPWMKMYPLGKQLFILTTENYSNHLLANLNEVFQFLDLASVNATEMSRIVSLPIHNTNRKLNAQVGPMLQKTRYILEQFYAPYNERLASLLQDKFLWH